MDLCGEHGYKEIAFSTERGASCPACDQIEDLQNKHAQEVENLKTDISTLDEELTEAQDLLKEKE